MRLRLAPVEYKVCSTPNCDTKYEGAQCPQCRYPFDSATARKELADRLILVDVDPPLYEPTHRCRCTACKGLFGLHEGDVVLRARCDQCRQPLFSRDSLQNLWQGTETLLQRARALDRARSQLLTCPHCTHAIPLALWCPLALTVPHPSTKSTLPQNFLVAWVRTFQTRESIEELQVREWREDAGDDIWNINKLEAEHDDAEEEETVHAE
jgi:hypothetical protein